MKNCTSVKDELEQRQSFRYASHTKLSTLKNTQKDINGYGRHLYLLLQQRQNDRLKIAENFSRPGWSVFIDLTIQRGQRFDQEIQSELQQARAAVGLWSISKNFWQKIQMKRLKNTPTVIKPTAPLQKPIFETTATFPTPNAFKHPGEPFIDTLKNGGRDPEMVVITADRFLMGSSKGIGYDFERPQHEVSIPQAFAMG